MFYLLHGEDEFTSREQLKQLRQKGDFGYNQDTYSGTEVDLKTIVMTTSTLPFLSEQRLVVLDGLPKKEARRNCLGCFRECRRDIRGHDKRRQGQKREEREQKYCAHSCRL